MGVLEGLFGGENQVGFFGGGQRVADQANYQLPQFQQMQQQYGDLANRALGMQSQMRQRTPEEMAAERHRIMLEVAAGRLPPDALNQIQTQVAGGPAVQVAQPQDQFRGQQQDLAGSLFGTLSGATPSVAQQQLQQSTQGNIANAYAMAQSGRYNPAAARMAAQNAGMMNQQGAGQAALLRAQEIQNAQGMLGNVLGGGRAQDIGQFQAQNQVAQGYLGQNLQASQAQLAAQMQREQQAGQNFGNAQQNALGGKILSAAGSVFGGMSGMGMFGGGGARSGGGGQTYGVNPSTTMIDPRALPQFASGGAVKGYAKGGALGAMGDRLCPGCGHRNSECECWKHAYGGPIPGKAKTGAMDSESNDTVPALLSPGEVVLPRSIALADDAPERAKLFVQAIKSKRMKKAA